MSDSAKHAVSETTLMSLRAHASGPKRGVLDLRRTSPAGASGDHLEGVIADYLAAKREGQDGRRPCGPGTLESYAFALRSVLLPHVREQGITSWEGLSQAHVSELRRRLFEEGRIPGQRLSPASANTYMRHINYFLSWLHREGEVQKRVKGRVLPEISRAAQVLDDRELVMLEKAATHERDRLIIRILADTGIRVSELTTLRYDRLIRTRDQQLMRVLEKGGEGVREREVPLVMPGILRRLERYIEATGGRSPEQPYVLVGKLRSRLTGQLEPLTPNGVQQMLRHLGQRVGLGKSLTPHILRHTFITRALVARVDPITIAKIVGHRDLRMIMTHYDRSTVLDAGRVLAQALARDQRAALGR